MVEVVCHLLPMDLHQVVTQEDSNNSTEVVTILQLHTWEVVAVVVTLSSILLLKVKALRRCRHCTRIINRIQMHLVVTLNDLIVYL